MVRGVFVSRKEAENTTLAEALDRYLQEVSSKKKGAYQESRRIENLKSHKLAKRYLASIQGKDIAEYRDERLKSVSQASVRLELALLSHLFNTAIREWGMNGILNPVSQIRLPKKAISRDRRLLPGEEEKILGACDEYGGDLPYVVRLALATGMRRGELASLVWDNIDLKKRTATLPETKNGEKRIVPLSFEAVQILKDLPRRLDGNVFGFVDSHSITTAFIRSVSRARSTYEKECAEKGMKPDPGFLVNLTFHDLRHEATSRFFELGLDTPFVKKITGHKTYQMLDRYTHLRAEDIAEKLDQLNKQKAESLVKG
ncbi:putative phage integrase [Leptospirillum ferriphilum ML-04]|uniref:Putative phage integrase n=2 Tax=Leptospirillum ferriphilum TaxID=178606 RepID=J9ZBI1_LEPFM|nr:putative phage integrase [Leptospirillum ferriphilum ML-04]